MTPIQIVSLVLSILAAVYLAVMIFVISTIGHFVSRMRKVMIGISIVLSERKEIFLSIVDDFQNMGVSFRGSDIAVFDQVRAMQADHLKARDVSEISALFREAESRLRFLFGKNPWANKSAKQRELWSTLEELDANYRQTIVNYNTELTGYNYWVKVPFCHWIPWLFGFRVREKLN